MAYGESPEIGTPSTFYARPEATRTSVTLPSTKNSNSSRLLSKHPITNVITISTLLLVVDIQASSTLEDVLCWVLRSNRSNNGLESSLWSPGQPSSSSLQGSALTRHPECLGYSTLSVSLVLLRLHWLSIGLGAGSLFRFHSRFRAYHCSSSPLSSRRLKTESRQIQVTRRLSGPPPRRSPSPLSFSSACSTSCRAGSTGPKFGLRRYEPRVTHTRYWAGPLVAVLQHSSFQSCSPTLAVGRSSSLAA